MIVQKTGQTTIFYNGDDGYYQKGKTFPIPRFSIDNDICVLDNMTGLMWTIDANLNERNTWNNQVVFCNNLNYGEYTDWRMPNINEIQSLSDIQNGNAPSALPSLPFGHPFINIKSRYCLDALWADGFYDLYWTSTTYSEVTTQAFSFQMWDNWLFQNSKLNLYFVWPVRGPD